MSTLSSMTDKDRSIVTQVAYKEACAIARENPGYQAGIYGEESDVNAWHEWFSRELDFQVSEIFRVHATIEPYQSTEAAQGALQQAFPGAQPMMPGAQQAAYPQQVPPMQPPQYQQPMQGGYGAAPGGGYQAPQAPVPQQQYAPQPQQFQPPQQGFQPPVQQGYMPPPQQAAMSNDEAWNDLLHNPHMWKDERRNKRQPTSPDFVHVSMKTSKGKDLALWLQGQYGQPPQHILMALQQQGRA